MAVYNMVVKNYFSFFCFCVIWNFWWFCSEKEKKQFCGQNQQKPFFPCNTSLRVCVSLLSWPPLLLFLLVSQAMPSLQNLNPLAPYPYPPPCTSVVLVARCLPPQNPSLHANKTFFSFPLRTATVRWKPLVVSFAQGFVMQVIPHSP